MRALIRSPTQQRTRVGDLLTSAKDDADLTWLEVDAATRIKKTTREGWFRLSTRHPPLGPVLYLADYLGVDLKALVEAALEDYEASGGVAGTQAASAEGSDPRGPVSVPTNSTEAISAREAEPARGERKRRRPPPRPAR